MYTTAELRRLAEIYIAATGDNHFALSVQISGRSNNRVIQRLLDGLGIGAGSAERTSNFFDQHWPDNLAWPKGINRNCTTKAAAE